MRSFVRLSLLLALAAPTAAFAWGFAGHRKIASKIAEPLPTGCLKSWLAAQAATTTFQNASTDPDTWRDSTSPSYDPNEAPRHYLDIDYANPITSYPRDWAAVQAQFNQYAVANGQVPWRVEEYYATLVQLFQNKDSAGASLHLGRFTHYLDDPFSPMHDTKDSFPKLNANDTVGGHIRYESDMLQVSSNLTNIANKANSYYGTVGRADPKNNIFDAIIVGNPLAQTVTNAYMSGQGDLPTLYNATFDLTSRRWGDAITLIASIVASAWVDAGRPILTGMPSGCSTAVPQGTMQLVGYPLPVTPDAGVPDSGVGGGDGGGAGGGTGGGFTGAGGGGGGGNQSVNTGPGGCEGCGGGTGAVMFLPFLGFAFFSRRRSR